MSFQRLLRIRAPAGLAAAVLLAVACGGGDGRELGVGVRDIATDVGLGIEDRGFDLAPVNTLIRRPPPASRVPTRPRRFVAPPGVPDVPDEGLGDFECRQAPLTEFPDEASPIAVTGQRPEEGSYIWMAQGKIKTREGDVSFEFPEPRAIFNVHEDPTVDGAFLFDMFQLVLADFRTVSALEFQITTFLVITKSPTEQADVDRDEAEGIYIEQILSFGQDEKGQPFFRRFRPKPVVLILPFPAQPGLEINSTGVDQHGAEAPTPGQPPPTPNPEDDRVLKLTVTGVVKGKEHVDACGEKVDSWLVDGRREFSVTNPNTLETETTLSKWNYNIGTQFGGMLVKEAIKTPESGPILDFTSRLGMVKPFVVVTGEDG